MRFLYVFMPRGWRQRQKYQGKMARQQWRDMKHGRRVARNQHVTAELTGQTDHSMPWWREPSLASLIGRGSR